MHAIVGSQQWLWMGLIAAVLAGCAKGRTKAVQLDLVPVAGTITLDGAPLSEATISFFYDGTPPDGFYSSGATTDAQGHYKLQTMGQDGTIPGQYKVILTKQVNSSGAPIKLEEGMDMEQLRASGGVKEMVPQKYTAVNTTDLTTTVEKGKADGYNFDLKSG